MVAPAIEEDKQLAGFLEAVEKNGRGRIKAIPVVQAKSMSGGPVDSLFYSKIKNLIIDAGDQTGTCRRHISFTAWGDGSTGYV
ncbi:MAG: hypothetical protein U5L72_03690 [Bacteroidales bacterium]|nr:hypothetical protein [Bacteroidales bacterium]